MMGILIIPPPNTALYHTSRESYRKYMKIFFFLEYYIKFLDAEAALEQTDSSLTPFLTSCHTLLFRIASDLFDVKLPYDAPVCSLCRSVGWLVDRLVGVGVPVIIS